MTVHINSLMNSRKNFPQGKTISGRECVMHTTFTRISLSKSALTNSYNRNKNGEHTHFALLKKRIGKPDSNILHVTALSILVRAQTYNLSWIFKRNQNRIHTYLLNW